MGEEPQKYPSTPDRRYFVVRGRLWRLSNPTLPAPFRKHLVAQLMDCRRGIRVAVDSVEKTALRAKIQALKVALGERGPVWWADGEPDYNRYKVENTPYRNWYLTRAELPAIG
jgi:hypothetical protein